MIETKKQLHDYLQYEKKMYAEYMFPTKARYILAKIKREPARIIYNFLVYSRKSDYYYYIQNKKGGLLNKLLYLYYVSKRNRLGEKLGFEIESKNIGKGCLIYHYNNVINGGSVIGENSRLHGDNCIGNNGKTDDCPKLGDNVSLGVGAKIIGPVTIANNVKIAAGAVVLHSFLEDGITIGGIPAKKLK